MNQDPCSTSVSSSRLANLCEAVAGLVTGTLLTESEASGYVAGILAPDRTREVEKLLAETPEIARELHQARREFAEFYTAEKQTETEERLRQLLNRTGALRPL